MLEKENAKNDSVACIPTLPLYQHKNYGKIFIAFNYKHSKLEQSSGSLEKPLSDMGTLNYCSFCSGVFLDILKDKQEPVFVKDLR